MSLTLNQASADKRNDMGAVLGLASLFAVAAVIALVVVWGRFNRYRAIYLHTDEDMKTARQNAAKQSRSVLNGKASEQLVALLPEFCERFDANDARFLGAPIDYVIFDGLARGCVERVVFLEVKTGRSSLNRNEQQVRRAIDERRVEFETLRLSEPRQNRVALLEPSPDVARTGGRQTLQP